MTDEPPPPQQVQQVEMEIPAEVEAGVHADFANIWHTPDTFVFDFAALRRPPVVEKDPATGQSVIKVSSKVVARLRIPPSQIFEFMKALEQQLSAWEQETGKKA